MIEVLFLPENKRIELRLGSTILESGIENGINIPSLCQMGTCSTCMVYVEKGAEYLFENFGDGFYDEQNISKSILSCITELRDEIKEGEIIININKIE